MVGLRSVLGLSFAAFAAMSNPAWAKGGAAKVGTSNCGCGGTTTPTPTPSPPSSPPPRPPPPPSGGYWGGGGGGQGQGSGQGGGYGQGGGRGAGQGNGSGSGSGNGNGNGNGNGSGGGQGQGGGGSQSTGGSSSSGGGFGSGGSGSGGSGSGGSSTGGSGSGGGGGSGSGGAAGGNGSSSSSGSSGGGSQSSGGSTTSTSTSTTVSTGVNTGSSASSTANSIASANALLNSAATSAAGGGGGGWTLDQGVSGVIQALHVEGGDPMPQCVCTQYRSEQRFVAVQAVCLDDKAVPHPASQVMPERDVAPNFDGEIYRCIAGARMQYTLGTFAGQASFDHGQTITCDKGMALYHGADGRLACRPQKLARDCNERSLLRRYGAGIKVLSAVSAQTCVAYRGEAETAAVTLNMSIDGGVGGVVH